MRRNNMVRDSDHMVRDRDSGTADSALRLVLKLQLLATENLLEQQAKADETIHTILTLVRT